MSECISLDVANYRKQELISIGLDSSVIKIHPNNLKPNNSNELFDDSYYGAKLLGSYIGTQSYIRKQLKELNSV